MSRPTKKRALMATESSTDPAAAPAPAASSAVQRRTYPTSLTTTTSSQKSTTTKTTGFFTANLNASVYKAELEHERSLRALDAKKSQQEQLRLQRQVEFAVEEAELAKSLLEDERRQSESHMEQLRQARDDALEQLRNLQYEQNERDQDDDEEEEERQSTWRQHCERLQSDLQAKDEEMAQLRHSLKTMQDQMKDFIAQKDTKDAPSTPPEKSAAEGQSSPAPTDLLSELNRVRIALAESERKQRQSRRAAEEWQKKAKQLLPEREAARSSNLRVQQLETQLRDVRQKHLSTQAKNEQWQTFGKTLALHFDVAKQDFSTPPEVSSILRQAEAAKNELEQAKQKNLSLEQRLEKIQDWKKPTEARMKALDEQETKWQHDRKDLEKRLYLQERQVETLQKQEAIWKREIAGLQRLVQTYDDLPIHSSSGEANSSAAEGASAKLQTVQLELKSTQEELEVVKQDRTRIHQELTKTREEYEEQRQELDRVKEKYGKLREALEVQRERAQEAEARANRAEELSGKGSFNPAETRVLHLQKNPMSQTLQEQNTELRKQLREALQAKGVVGGDLNISMTTAAATNSGTEVNPDKLHQRLKQSFKEQIGLFREGVHLITGFKIDMLPVDDHRPTFRVRSMYGERETDELMLKWPKLPEGQHPKSMDLLGTEWANTLARTDSYEYLSKFDSLPAFLASLQLKLFESQTFMG